MRQSRAETLATEEPDELIAHVRVCGGAGWVTTGSTRKPTASSVRCAADSLCNIPIADGKDAEEILGSAAYLNPKGRGDTSMPIKPGTAEDADNVARQDPRAMAKAGLLAVQCPAVLGGLWRQRLTARWTLRRDQRTACATSASPAPPNEGGEGRSKPPPSRGHVWCEGTAGGPTE